jgi:hypothetical protein
MLARMQAARALWRYCDAPMGPIYPIAPDLRGHGLAFAVAFGLPFIGGIALDVRLHTVPFFIAGGCIGGFLAFVGVFLFYRADFRE